MALHGHEGQNTAELSVVGRDALVEEERMGWALLCAGFVFGIVVAAENGDGRVVAGRLNGQRREASRQARGGKATERAGEGPPSEQCAACWECHEAIVGSEGSFCVVVVIGGSWFLGCPGQLFFWRVWRRD